MDNKNLRLHIGQEDQLEDVAFALNAISRRNILRLLRTASYSIADLARQLKLPVSTAAFHVNALKKAGLVTIAVNNNSRGNAKIVSRRMDSITLDLVGSSYSKKPHQFIQEIPLGSFTDAYVETRCGMATERGIIAEDIPGAFFSPDRLQAQFIWFSKGFLEYKVPNHILQGKQLKSVTFSMEICSKAPRYRNDWESEITFWINKVEVASFLSLGDFGNRRGRLNPDWWPEHATQYGIVKNLRITHDGVYLDETQVSDHTLETLRVQEGGYIQMYIGVKPDARKQGGISLFGEKFGDFSQGLIFMADYM